MNYLRMIRSVVMVLLCGMVASAQEVRGTAESPSQGGSVQAPKAAASGDSSSAEASTPATASDKHKPAPPADEPNKVSAVPTEQLSPELRTSRNELRRCLAYYFFRPESSAQRSPWGVMHAIVGFGVDTRLEAGAEDYSAIGWMCSNQSCQGLRLFQLNDGKIAAPIAAGYQGHEGQFLHIMAFSRVPKDYAMKIDGHDFTIEDLIQREQQTCRSGTELTFKLAALVHYLDSDAAWRNQSGEEWSMERLIKEELSQTVTGAACGGTHRLMGLGYAVRKRQERGEPLTGQWARAKNFVEDYVALAYKLQNSDGSFSTNWFAGSGSGGDINRKLNTTGHTLEWLLVSLPDDQLNNPRLVKAAQCLTALMWNYRDRAWEIGPRGHALHALALVDERVFGGKPGERKVELAQARDDQAGRIAGGPEFNVSESRTPVKSVPRTGLFGRGRR